MAVNINKLKGKTREMQLTDEKVASLLGMHPATYSRKLNGENGETFTLRQVFALVEILTLTNAEAIEIFFGNKLA